MDRQQSALKDANWGKWVQKFVAKNLIRYNMKFLKIKTEESIGKWAIYRKENMDELLHN